MTRWAAFLDLLGTRERALVPSIGLTKALRHFHEELAVVAESLSTNDRCYVMSDSAFFDLRDLPPFLEAMRNLRQQLLSREVSFKCAVVLGDVGVQRVNVGRLEGFSFGGPGAASAYLAHEMFHGIGFCLPEVEVKNVPKAVRERFLVEAEHTVRGDGKSRTTRLQRYFDLQYSVHEIGKPINEPRVEGERPTILGEVSVNNVLREAFKARLISPYVASSYVSQLIAMVRSSDFGKMNYEQSRWSEFPVIFKAIYLEDGLRRCSDIPGIATVYLSILREILSQRKAVPPWIDRLISRMFTQKAVENAMRIYGNEFFDPTQREFVHKRWAELATRREAMQAVR